jgi:hypothetical protein
MEDETAMFTKTRNKRFISAVSLLLLAGALVLALCPAAYAEDWQAMYEALCGNQMPVVYPATATGKEFDIALLTPQLANRPDNQSIVMTVMGDGFTVADQAKFNYYAQMFAKNVLQISPYDEYVDRLKIYRVNVISNESGITRDSSTDGQNVEGLDPRDTYFGGSCWNSGTQRSLSANRDKVLATGRAHTTNDTLIMLLMNT